MCGVEQSKYGSCQLWGCHLLWMDPSRSLLHLLGSCKLLSDRHTGSPTRCKDALCRLAKTRSSERVLQRKCKVWNKQRIENNLKKIELDLPSFKLKCLEGSRLGFIDFTGCGRDFKSTGVIDEHVFSCVQWQKCNMVSGLLQQQIEKKRKTRGSNFILCQSSTMQFYCLVLRALTFSSTRLINTDKFSVNTRDTEKLTTSTIFKLQLWKLVRPTLCSIQNEDLNWDFPQPEPHHILLHLLPQHTGFSERCLPLSLW